MEQLGFSPVSVKQTQWLALRRCQADLMIDSYWDRFKFLLALKIKYFRKKMIFYVIQCKIKGIPQSSNT